MESWAELWIKGTGSGLGTLGKNPFLGLLGEKMAFLLVKSCMRRLGPLRGSVQRALSTQGWNSARQGFESHWQSRRGMAPWGRARRNRSRSQGAHAEEAELPRKPGVQGCARSCPWAGAGHWGGFCTPPACPRRVSTGLSICQTLSKVTFGIELHAKKTNKNNPFHIQMGKQRCTEKGHA